MSESDICDRYVALALDTAGWTPNQLRREYGFTDGKIIVRGKLVARGKRKRADYLRLLDDELLDQVESLAERRKSVVHGW